MQNSDVAYIKAMLWGIIGSIVDVCQDPKLPDPMFWIITLNILFYGIESAFYKYKENSE